jgi:hypothetical protein
MDDREWTGTELDNVVPLSRPADDRGLFEALATWRDATDEYDRRLSIIEARLEAIAAELAAHPDSAISGAAGAVADGNSAAHPNLAVAVRQAPTWWERHRGWLIPTLVGGAVVTLGYRVMRDALRAARTWREEAEASRERFRLLEQEYLTTYAALQREQSRPLHAHTHAPERVIERAVPQHVERVIERQPVIQPAVHTREIVERPRVIERMIERQPIVKPTVHTREVVHATAGDRCPGPSAKLQRAIDESRARARRHLA